MVELRLSPIFRDLRNRLRGFQRDVHQRASLIVRFEEQLSIRQRFYRTGKGLLSLFETQTEEGNRLRYEITFLRRYMLFGEYGTGRRGAASGRPAPRGYTYGQRAGMTARRFSRIAVAAARPKIDRMAHERARQLALNATVN